MRAKKIPAEKIFDRNAEIFSAEILIAESFSGRFHIFANLDAERAAFFAGAALNTFACVVLERGVVFADGFRNIFLRERQIQKFMDVGDVTQGAQWLQ